MFLHHPQWWIPPLSHLPPPISVPSPLLIRYASYTLNYSPTEIIVSFFIIFTDLISSGTRITPLWQFFFPVLLSFPLSLIWYHQPFFDGESFSLSHFHYFYLSRYPNFSYGRSFSVLSYFVLSGYPNYRLWQYVLPLFLSPTFHICY